MTAEQKYLFETEILHAALAAERAANDYRLRLSLIGQHLTSLGRALQLHPEAVTPVPEPRSMYDYREAINDLDRKKVVELCNELRALIQVEEAAQKRVAMLSSGPFASRDSGVS
jgi:hypothetical protein